MNRCLAVDQEIEGDVVKRAGTQTRDHGGLQMHHDLLDGAPLTGERRQTQVAAFGEGVYAACGNQIILPRRNHSDRTSHAQ